MMTLGIGPRRSMWRAALMTMASGMGLGALAMHGCAGSPAPQDEPPSHDAPDACAHEASAREGAASPEPSDKPYHCIKPNQETPYNKGNIDSAEDKSIDKTQTLAPGEHPTPQAPGPSADAQPSPMTLALAQVIQRQRERIAACHQAHDPASGAWGACLCQAMCEAPLQVQPPLTGPVTLRWPMISAAMGAYSISYDARGQVQQCARQTRLVSEVFFCDAQTP